jgi:hypothetical protein
LPPSQGVNQNIAESLIAIHHSRPDERNAKSPANNRTQAAAKADEV